MRITSVTKKISAFVIIFLLLLAVILLTTSNKENTSLNDVEQIPPKNIINVGEGWANNAINTTIYRHHGIVTLGDYQILAF